MKLYYRTILLTLYIVLSGIKSYSQSSSFVGLEIDRIFIKNGNGIDYQMNWQDYEASQWGLIKKSKKVPFEFLGQTRYVDHEWWGWNGETIKTEVLKDSSLKTTSQNRYIQTSLNLHPQFLYITIKNTTSYYVTVDFSTVYINLSYPESDLQRSQKHYEVSEAVLSVRNYKGDPYHFVVIPPYKSVTSGFYKLNYENDANFIHPSILNNSRMDISMNMSIYRANPIIANRTILDNYKTINYGYFVLTPTKVPMPFKGGYYQDDDGAYYIINDCVNLFESPDMRVQQQIICKIKKDSREIPTKLNSFGFLVYRNKYIESDTIVNNINKNSNGSQDVPTNNLGKSLSQMRQIYSNINFRKKDIDKEEYISDNVTLVFKNSKLIAETCYFKGNSLSKYKNIISTLNNTSFIRKSEETINEVSRDIIFIYPKFYISLSYMKDFDSYSITYVSKSYFESQ